MLYFYYYFTLINILISLTAASNTSSSSQGSKWDTQQKSWLEIIEMFGKNKNL